MLYRQGVIDHVRETRLMNNVVVFVILRICKGGRQVYCSFQRYVNQDKEQEKYSSGWVSKL